MSTTKNSQSRPHEYGDGFNDDSSFSSFLNNQDDQERPITLGGFINLLKAHEGHFYRHPCIEDVISSTTFLKHYLHHDSYSLPIGFE